MHKHMSDMEGMMEDSSTLCLPVEKLLYILLFISSLVGSAT